MPTTPILGITQVSASQNSKEITINDAVLALEGAVAGVKTISYASVSDYTLTATETTRNMVFKAGTATANCTLRFPNSINGNPTERTIVVRNDSGFQLTVRAATGAGTTVVVPNGGARLISISGGDVTVAAQPATLVNFVDLDDSPGTYVGNAGKVLAVNVAESQLEFIDVVSFPAYVGNAGKVLVVNGGENGVQWVDYATSFLALTDTPNSYTGNAGKIVAVNDAGTSLEFVEFAAEAVEFLPATRWRIRTLDLPALSDKSGWGEIEFLDVDGLDLTDLPGGTASASSFSTGKEALYAFDNDTSAGNGWMSDTTDADTAWIEFEFADPQVVRRVRLTPIDQLPEYSPTSFIIERHNGTGWVSAGLRTPIAWASGVSQTFAITGSPLTSISEAPNDGNYYARRNEGWVEMLEAVRDNLASVLTDGTNIAITVDDVANTITIGVTGDLGLTEEEVRDLLGVTLVEGTGINLIVDDVANTITIAISDELTTGESYRGEWTSVPGDLNFDTVFPPIFEEALLNNFDVFAEPDVVGGHTQVLRGPDLGILEAREFSFDVTAESGDNTFALRAMIEAASGSGINVKVDGVHVANISRATLGGQGIWGEWSTVLANGTHTITLRWFTESGAPSGRDRCFISEIRIPSAGVGGYRYTDIVDFDDGSGSARYICLNAGAINDPSNTDDWQKLGGSSGGGSGLPAGGTTGQFLAKASNADGDADWVDAPSGGGSVPAGGTTGQVLTKLSNSDGDADWADPTGGSGGSGGLTFAGASVVRTSALAVVPPQTIAWQAAQFDTNGFWNIANPSRLTVPTGVSKIRLTASLDLDANFDIDRSLVLLIVKNGVTADAGRVAATVGETSDYVAPTYSLVSGILNVVPGDYFEVYVVSNDTSFNIDPQSVSPSSLFQIEVVEGSVIGSSTGGGGTTAVGAHRYWRLADMHPQTYRGASMAFAALELRPSVGGTPHTISAMSASSSFSGQAVSNLIDGNDSTVWGNNADENRTWLIADLGSPKVVGEIMLKARADSGFETDIPKYFVLQYGDSIDGPWTEVLAATLADVTAVSQVRTATVPLNWPSSGSGAGVSSNVMAKGRIAWTSAGVATVVGGFNVASVTRTSEGHFTVTFTNPVPAGCVVQIGGRFGDTGSNDAMIVAADRAAGKGVTTTELNFVCQVSNNSGAFDPYAAGTSNSWVYFEIIDPTAALPGNVGSSNSVVSFRTGTAYDVVAADNGMYMRFTNAAAKTVNVRPESFAALPANGEWHIRNVGAANLTITPDSGVTINAPAGGTLVVPERGTVTLKRVAVNEFDLLGQTVPA